MGKSEEEFVCKFCNKRYPCGKSLGGHIRTHMNNENSAEISINKLLSSSNASNMKRAAEAEDGGQSRYGLRDNPKKTKKFSDSGTACLLKEMICKECGKGFHSLKALCGHMACHSEKERAFEKLEDDSGNSEKQKMIMDSVSDSETIGVYSKNSVSLAEMEEEQQEMAMCLMMLSRGSGCKKGLNSVANSSDNNSVVLEAKSSSIDVRIIIKNDMKCASNGGAFVKMKKQRDIKLKPENSDSGYFGNASKKVKSDVSMDRFLKNVDLKNLKVDFDAKLGKSLSKFKCENNLGNDSLPVPLIDSKVTKSSHDPSNVEKRLGSKKTKDHVCPLCFRVFKSGQALGGHKRSHFVGGSEERTLVIKQDSPQMSLPSLIDLNLPVPAEEDAMGNAEFMPW